MKDFVEFLFKEIVSKPEEVTIQEQGDSSFTTFLVKVDAEDMPLAIGKGGRTIKSIRNLVKTKAIKDDLRVNVELSE